MTGIVFAEGFAAKAINVRRAQPYVPTLAVDLHAKHPRLCTAG